MTTAILAATGLTKRYGNRVVVDHIDLSCRPGTVLGLLGLALVAVLFYRPHWLVFAIFAAILQDQLGKTGFSMARIPITAAKLSVLGGLGIWLGLALGLVVVAGLLVWRFHRRERFWRPPPPVNPPASPPATPPAGP